GWFRPVPRLFSRLAAGTNRGGQTLVFGIEPDSQRVLEGIFDTNGNIIDDFVPMSGEGFRTVAVVS
ncbi:MAG TPA: hypothetical protein VKI65_00275, partial [Gemmataceae bacterium]|nr:hypothetical protein [Gemmataceae bacterium]